MVAMGISGSPHRLQVAPSSPSRHTRLTSAMPSSMCWPLLTVDQRRTRSVSSTNLGGWINKTGVWSVHDPPGWVADDTERVLRWSTVSNGQHIELGIAEVNLVCLLGELGATWSRWGEPLIPIATIYDPFVSRALEPWSYGIYAGGQSILVGTPSGVTLAPEGGAHQSIITPSIGMEQPGCVAWEPAFGPDLEWCFLHAMSQIGRPDGTSAYFRLSTRPIDPALAALPEDPVLA